METTKRTIPQVAVTNKTRKIRAIIREHGSEVMRPILALAKEIKHKIRLSKSKRHTKTYNNEEGC